MRRRVMSQKIMIECIESLTVSGMWIVPPGCIKVEIFMVGGGGSGKDAGGGGGYTALYTDEVVTKKAGSAISVTPGQFIDYVIGEGGVYIRTSSTAMPGSPTKFGTLIVMGGGGGGGDSWHRDGGKGGSGGAGYGVSDLAGGRNGGDGESGSIGAGGLGQHYSTICPFNNVEYACGGNYSRTYYPPNGEPNTGNGASSCESVPGSGGSGIIILRYKRYKI